MYTNRISMVQTYPGCFQAVFHHLSTIHPGSMQLNFHQHRPSLFSDGIFTPAEPETEITQQKNSSWSVSSWRLSPLLAQLDTPSSFLCSRYSRKEVVPQNSEAPPSHARLGPILEARDTLQEMNNRIGPRAKLAHLSLTENKFLKHWRPMLDLFMFRADAGSWSQVVATYSEDHLCKKSWSSAPPIFCERTKTSSVSSRCKFARKRT